MAYDQIEKIADGSESFRVVADRVVGKKIARFLADETAFRNGPKDLRGRLRFLFRGMLALSIPGFMPVWNKAIMRGYGVTLEETESNLLINFQLGDRRS